jgi:hypothetical protein
LRDIGAHRGVRDALLPAARLDPGSTRAKGTPTLRVAAG